MSNYTVSYSIRYSIPHLSQQTEVAAVDAAINIQNEDPATTDHANRLRWANWTIPNSSVAWQPFAWPVAQNPTIVAEIQNDPSGQTVQDSDVQFVVNSYVETVITEWAKNNPAPA
jgi:hypothetical protein